MAAEDFRMANFIINEGNPSLQSELAEFRVLLPQQKVFPKTKKHLLLRIFSSANAKSLLHFERSPSVYEYLKRFCEYNRIIECARCTVFEYKNCQITRA